MLKKRYLLLILIVSLFALSAVSAVDNDTALISIDYDSSLIAGSFNQNDSYGTFQELQDEINALEVGGTLNLTRNYMYVNGSTGGVDIYKSMTINGHGYTIDGNGQSRIFYVGASNVVLNNLTLMNGYSESNSGGISWYGSNGSIKYVKFYNNTALEDGGAVYARGDVLKIQYCNFTNNEANTGGGIYCYDTSLKIKDTYFIKNIGWDRGGAIHCRGPNSEVDNCTFIKNEAYTSGAVNFDRPNCIVNNSLFIENVAYRYGGAFWWIGTQGILNNSIFINNKASEFAQGISWTGSKGILQNLIYYYTDTLSVRANNTLINCSEVYNTLPYWNYIVENNNLTKYYNESTNFTVRILKSEGGYVGYGEKINFIINDANYEKITDSEGYVSFNETLQPNNYTIKTFYKGCEVTNEINIIPTLYNNDMEIFSIDITEGETEVISVVLPNDATGNVSTTIYGKKYSAKVDKGNAKIMISDLEYGEYSIEVIYSGDSQYNSIKNFTFFIVKNAINLTVPNVTKYYGEFENLVITLTRGDTPITYVDLNINFNGFDYIRTTDSEGKAYFDLDLNAGTYDAIVSYGNVSTTAHISINQLITNITLSCDNSSYRWVTLAALVNQSTATGNIVFNVNGNDRIAEIRDGEAICNLVDLAPGSYTVKATYEGDVNHKNSTSDTLTFYSPDYIITAPDVSMDYSFSKYLDITLTRDNNPINHANININLNGKNYTRTTDSEGKVSFYLILNAGSYDAVVSYGNVSTISHINVNKLTTETTLSYQKHINTWITLTASVNQYTATGNIVFNVNGNNYTAEIKDHEATYDLINLAPGNYTVKATYDGDVNHENSTSDTLIVNSPDYVITAPDVSMDYGASKYLEITLTRGGEYIGYAEVNINILSTNYTKTTNSMGKVYFDLNLNPGTYDAVVSYGNVSATSHITVNQLTTETTLSYVNNSYGSVTLIASVNLAAATGNVIFNINGSNYTSKISDYEAIYTLNNLTPGVYNVNATYEGDTYHKSSISNNISFVIEDNLIDINAPDLTKYYGSSEMLVVTVEENKVLVVDGQVTFIINGVTLTRTTDDNGQASIAINLNPGAYDVIVNYKDTNVTSKVTVLPTIIGSDVVKIYGNDTQYYATFIDSKGNYLAKGTAVIFNINGFIYDRKIMDNKGTARFDINENPGTYVITAHNYVTGEFHSNNITVLPNIVENNDLVKYYNESSKFSVKVLSPTGNPASGEKVKFIINNKTYESTSNSNGYAFLDAVLQPEEYVVTTSYGGLEVNNTIVILATLYDKDMNVSSSDIQEGENEIIAVVLPNDATGKVSTIINGKEYSANVNKGKANINISDLKYGNYKIEVTYSGDSKYNSVKGKTVFIVDKSFDISMPDVTKYYHGSERLYVTLKDKNNQPIANANVKININGVDYDRTTGATGQTSIALGIPSGNYTATVEYNGFKTQSHVEIKPTVNGNNIVKIFRNATQYYAKFVDTNGNILKNTPVTFNINGVFYTRTTNENGIAKMNINLNPGEYIITATNPVSTEMYSNVVTVLPNIIENYDLTKYYKNASQYVIKVLDDYGRPVSGQSVDFNINGVFYTRTSNATGHVKMNINLNPGTYIITAIYKGFMAANTITVKSIIEANDLNMKYKDGSKFEAKLLDGQGNVYAGQKITFNINGVLYDRTTDANGIARLNINLNPGTYIITSTYNGLNIANTIKIALDPIYYTIGSNPLDYNYYMNEYNRFTWDWYYSPQHEAMVRTIYDIYGNSGMEIQDQYVHYGTKYICWDQSNRLDYRLNKDGEVISVTNMMDYYVDYKEYDYNNNELIYHNVYLPGYDAETTAEVEGYDVTVHQWRTPNFSEIDVIVTDKNGNMLDLYSYDTMILTDGTWYGPYDQVANEGVSTYHKWHKNPNSRTTEVAVKIKANVNFI